MFEGRRKRDDPFWTNMRRASTAPLLAIVGELDTPKGVKSGFARKVFMQLFASALRSLRISVISALTIVARNI